MVACAGAAPVARAQPAASEPGPGAAEPEAAAETEAAAEPEPAAEPEAAEPEPDAANPEDLEWKPPPGPTVDPRKAHGVVEGDPRRRKHALWIPRVILFVPRVAVRAVQMPFRGLAYLYDRYRLPQRFRDVFLMEGGRAGVVPVAQFQTGLGGRYGARFFHHDLFGHRESISARATFGRARERLFRVHAGTGRLLGERFGLDLVATYWFGQNTRFFGIGNGDLTDPDDRFPGRVRIDPLTDGTAIATRFKQRNQNYELGLRVSLLDGLRARLTTEIDMRKFLRRELGDRDVQDIAAIYDAENLVGFNKGLAASRTAFELTYNSLRKTRFWVSDAMPSTGWFVHGEAGYTKGFARSDPSNFVDWEADVQRLFDVYRGDRVIMLRAHVEGVSGAIEDVPFVRLPQLGGPNHLRGYQRFRFRDRLAAFGTVEYRYPIGEAASGYLFFDFGRAFRSASDIEFKAWRAGGGPGLVLHTRRAFIGRIHIAFNTDRSFFFAFNFNPLTT